LIGVSGFKNIVIQKDKTIAVPDDILSQYLTAEQMAAFKKSNAVIRSITVYAEKSAEERSCCGPNCCN